jgi:hypothetical protein
MAIPPKFNAGDRASASALSWIVSELLRLSRITGVPPVFVSNDPSGISVMVDLPDELWIKITDVSASDGSYGWKRQTPGTTAGTFIDHPSGQTGTTAVDPAWEANKNTEVPLNQIVPAWRDEGDNRVHFLLGTCPA